MPQSRTKSHSRTKNRLKLKELLATAPHKTSENLHVFATIALGVVESLEDGVLTAENSVREFFNAENCLVVKNRLKNRTASEIMGRGVQLPDLFDALPAETAHREFQLELKKIRSLSLKLLQRNRIA
jgi:hypothetical protein